jgi:proline iminopeptidase
MTTLPFLLQIALPVGLLAWHANVRVRTFTAWTLMTSGVALYLVATAVIGNWDVAPSYIPFVFLLALGASTWRRDAFIRALPSRPATNYEWREVASGANLAIFGAALALVAVASRPMTSEAGAIDTVTLNLYRQLASSLVGFVMFVAALRSPRVGRVLLSALFVWAAGTNLRIALTTPDDYLVFAQFAVLDVYRAFILGFFAQHTAAVIATIAIGQALIAFLLAANGRARRLGYIGAIVFLVAIVPLGVGAGFPATVLMALAAAEVLHSDRYAVFGRNINPTDEEVGCSLPGDELIATPLGVATHAVTIFKPAREVWPWLVQMGAGRGGWYSYDRLDNGGRTSATRIVPELQAVHVGTVFPALPGVASTFVVARLEPNDSLVLANPGPGGAVTTWAFVLEEPAPGVTRLIVRVRVAQQPTGIRTAMTLPLLRLVHFIMERKQLNTLAVRAERL